MSKDKKKLPPKETETVWENGKLVEKSLAEDPSIDALVEEHSAIDPDPWRAAYGALLDAEEAEPLAAMLAGSTPIPRWVRAGLAHLLDHTSGYDVGPDRLVFTRTQAPRRAIETNKKRIRVGAAVLDAVERGESYIYAVGEAAGEKDTHQSYEKKAYELAKRLPPPQDTCTKRRLVSYIREMLRFATFRFVDELTNTEHLPNDRRY
jgi:hypothetical protein